MPPKRLTLASRSPQRRAILEQLGVRFEVQVPEVEELTSGEPHRLVVDNARIKARAVRGQAILGADTAVVIDGRVLGKPADERQAVEFLRLLSGRVHEVMTGVALIEEGSERCDVAVTRVTFRDLDERDVGWYLDSGEWRERAGGYAIQARGAALVAGIEGDYWNVVGLPVALLMGLCRDFVTSATRLAGPGAEPTGR